jgi:hypothetical protein
MARSKGNTKSSRRPRVDVRYRFETRRPQHAITLLGDDPRNIESWLASLERRAEITSDRWRYLTGYATH